MILCEFAGADQGPDKFPQTGLALAAFRQDFLQLLDLIARGKTSQRGQIEFLKDLGIGRSRFQ